MIYLIRRCWLRWKLNRLLAKIKHGDYRTCLDARAEALRVLQEINEMRLT